MIVENRHDVSAAVKGTFLYQRKGPMGDWSDAPTISLSSLKKDEGYRLELKSGELLPFVQQLNALYRLHGEHGVPQGEIEFLKLADSLEGLSNLDGTEFRSFLEAHRAVGANLLNRLLTWVSSTPDINRLLEYLEPLEDGTLHALRTASGISTLEATLRYWKTRVDEEKEEFWQRALADRSFVLEQIYSWPVTIVQEKAYVGGKTVQNRGGGIVDFLVQNELTKNAALVEIKTPKTPLLDRRLYRDGVWPPSFDLSGAVVQVLSYRNRLLKEYHSLSSGQTKLFEAFEPSCTVIMGTVDGLNEAQRSSFELFRSQTGPVSIVTFDELFEKTRRVIGAMRVSVQSPSGRG